MKDTLPCIPEFKVHQKFCQYIPDFFWMKDSVPEVKYTETSACLIQSFSGWGIPPYVYRRKYTNTDAYIPGLLWMKDALLCVPEVKYTDTSAQFIPSLSGYFVSRNKSTPSILGTLHVIAFRS